MSECCLFSYQSAAEAAAHMRFEVVEDYGDRFLLPDGTVKHYLHVWDDGGRALFRCKNCGALFLRQKSEIHSMSDAGDQYFIDLYPVSAPEEAHAYNEKYSGGELEAAYRGLKLWCNDLRWMWNQA